MRRRDALRIGGTAVLGALAGCTSGGSSDSYESPFEGPTSSYSQPDSVYYPGHRSNMQMLGTKQLGNRTIGLSSTYGTGFWIVTGTQTQNVVLTGSLDTVHMMVSVWDTETKTTLPVASGLHLRIQRDGSTITEKTPWPMLSQQMGFHFGANIEFDEFGTYSVEVDPGPVPIPGVGPFEGRFQQSGTVSFEYEFARTEYNRFGKSARLERRGAADALEPMEGMRPRPIAPPKDEFPGHAVGTGTSGDAVFVVTTADVAAGTYITVSPRTPYNRYHLPLMALSMTVSRGGQQRLDTPLSMAIGPERGLHYRAVVDNLESDDKLTISIDSPPQVARHEGYETAFLEMPDVTVSMS